MNRDLTVGNPKSVLWRFCIPLFGSVLFQQMYNIADSFVAGKFIGEDALAAVGNSYGITMLFLAFAVGCNIGCSVTVSGLFGAKQYRNMKTAVSTAMIFAGILCVCLMLFGILGCKELLRETRTPDAIFADSGRYLEIYIWGLPFLFFYNIATGIFSALGDSRTPFLFLAGSSTANILADILFVSCFDMGVAGVAWATFLCQGVSCALSLWVVLQRLAHMPSEGRAAVFSFKLLGKIASVSVPCILQQSFISVGNIVIQGVINGFGPGVIAGYSAAVKLNNLVITSFTTLGNGMSNYTAQNMGAGFSGRIKEGFYAGIKMVWTLCVPIAALYFFAGDVLIRFFLDRDASEAALLSGVSFLKTVTPFYFVIAVKLIADGVLRGAGQMRQFMTATLADLVLRVALAVFLAGPFGTAGIFRSWPIGWGIATALSVWFYCRGLWERGGNSFQEGQALPADGEKDGKVHK